jgi:5-oxoprolinase (ATP-hydrolysing)
MSGAPRWQFWIDRGGTFVDCVAKDPATGRLHALKLLASDDAPLAAIRQHLGLAPDEPIPPCEVRMGTTLATNALLERKGAPTGLIITRGFVDLLEIGDQTRPDLFALDITRPAPLPIATVGIDHRLSADGAVLTPLDPAAALAGLEQLRRAGATSLAVVLLHAYRDGRAERQIAELAANYFSESFGADISLSHEVAGTIGLLARAETTVVDAYLTPLLTRHLTRLRGQLGPSRLQLMQSSGALCDAAVFRGRDAILSGPAGGAVAVGEIARDLGLGSVIGLDIGGTSTDVYRWSGAPSRTYEAQVAGVRVRTPMMDVHTVAAGGGSICRFDGHRFTVGPDSAGAVPGPLAYGHPQAAHLTLTDINLILGRIAADRFPFPLDRARVVAALQPIVDQLAARGDPQDPRQIAAGFFSVAVEGIAAAIRTISLARGHDPRSHALIVFGGAGGQLACPVARALGIATLIFHPLAGVLSAYGIGVARSGWHGEADAGRVILDDDRCWRTIDPLLSRLEARGRAHLAAQDTADELTCHRDLDLRYVGSEGALTLRVATPEASAGAAHRAEDLRARFREKHRHEHGWSRSEHPIEVVTARVELTEAAAQPPERASAAPSRPTDPPAPIRTTQRWADSDRPGAGDEERAPVFLREALRPGHRLDGPALILEATATIALDPGWSLEVLASGVIIARDHGRAVAPAPDHAAPDPALLEVFGGKFMAIAAQMGAVLQRTALSTNIRERLDFSCAVFDAAGQLCANAPHIPVHLGAMSEAIRGVLAVHPAPGVGDVYVTNDPAAGGSHLPDITVIAPVHDSDGALRFFTASRGHHADIGGVTPGSMPPRSRTLQEEGVVLRAITAVHRGALDRPALLRELSFGPYPARRPQDNIADLEAQIAACHLGARLLLQLCADVGEPLVSRYMAHLQSYAAAAVRRAIARLPPGTRGFSDRLDDGALIAVTVTIGADAMIIDFAGTAPAVDSNLNAPRAVTVAAVLYVLRLLAGEAIPLSSGCLAPITLKIPSGSILDPPPDRAVAAGNVETSQRVVDVLLAALGLAAASQGTMNNLTFGDATFGYYETLAGGAGATATADGAAAVHTHMTNTRLTDPEHFEARFPVRLWELSVRRGSGGAGQHRGGDGLCREFEALRPLEIGLLAERRQRPPFGLFGGRPGAPARDLLDGAPFPPSARPEGSPTSGKISAHVPAGARVRVETPGGGGYGPPPTDP